MSAYIKFLIIVVVSFILIFSILLYFNLSLVHSIVLIPVGVSVIFIIWHKNVGGYHDKHFYTLSTLLKKIIPGLLLISLLIWSVFYFNIVIK